MNYFVTGATGLVGQRLVTELLGRDPDNRVYALVRPGSLARLDKLRSRWSWGERMTPVLGDLARPSLGIETPPPAVDHFFHVAANYDLASDERTAFVHNVLGALHAVQLANQLDVQGFHYTSSIGVAGRHAGRFTEEMGDEGQLVDNPYFSSKLRAELVVRSVAAVPFTIYRLGAVVGDSATGWMTKVDGAYHFFPLAKALARLPRWLSIPGPQGGCAWVIPVDCAARALCHIAHLPVGRIGGATFHVVDPDPVRVGEAISAGAVSQGGPPVRPLVPLRITRRVGRVARALPLAGAVRRRVLRKIDIPEEMLDWRDFDAEFDTSGFEAALAGSGVACPPFPSYVAALFRYWDQHLNPRLAGVRLRRVLDGRRVLLTGASRGVGRSVARLVGATDCTLLVVARSPDRLAELVDELRDQPAIVVPLPCDLADRGAVSSLIDEVTGRWGGVDVLINNAGKSIRRAVEHSGGSLHDCDRTMNVNYFAPVGLTVGLLPGMRERQTGHVVNISSIGLQSSMSRFGAYNASKAALDAFVRSTAPEVWDDGVRFTTVYLPLVRTEMSAPTTAFRRLPSISGDAAARLITRALLERPVRVSTPLGTFAMFGETFLPRFMRQLMRLEYSLLPESEASIRAATTTVTVAPPVLPSVPRPRTEHVTEARSTKGCS